MTYENVDINVTYEYIIETLKKDGVNITFKLKHLIPKEMPLYDEMREQLKEDECWDDLHKLDYDGELPPLGFKNDKSLIEEIVDAVKTKHRAMDRTEIRFLRENRSEYFSGTGDDIKMVLKYTGS